MKQRKCGIFVFEINFKAVYGKWVYSNVKGKNLNANESKKEGIVEAFVLLYLNVIVFILFVLEV